MNAITNGIRQLRSAHPNALKIVQTIVVLIGIATVPLIYAGLLSWANIDPTGRLDTVPAAVVNEDAGSTDPELQLGADLTEELVDSTANNNLDWRQMSASRAQRALERGEVYAVLTIPESFSRDAASVGDDDPMKATRAKLTITTNDSVNVISGNIAQTIATTVTDTLASKVSDEYLANIYAGFSDIHSSLGDAASGAGELADGTGKAREGAGELVVGLGDLHAGTVSLADGATRLDSGARELADGTRRGAAGAGELASGADQLNGAAAQLAGGAGEVNSGAAELANGTGALASGASDVASGAQELSGGAARLADGAAQTDDGAKKLAEGANQVNDGATQLADGLARSKDGSQQLTDGLNQLNERVQALPSQPDQVIPAALDAFDNTSVPIREDLETFQAEADSLAAEWDTLSPEEQQQRLTALADQARGMRGDFEKAGTELREQLTGANNPVAELQAGVEQLAQGANELNKGLGQLSTGASDLADGTGELSSGANALADGTSKLRTGAADLANGASRLSDGAGTLAGGASELDGGAARLAQGTDQLASGAGQLAGGTDELAGGARELADGSTQLAQGANQLARGTGELASGAGELEGGADRAAVGAQDLEGGLGQLDQGASTLERSLAAGQSDVPNYSSSESSHVASVGSHPVDLSKERLHEVASYGYGLGPYFMSLSLWVGALAFFLMFPALHARFVGSQMPAPVVALASYGPAALMAVVQAVLMMVIVHHAVGIEFKNFGAGLLVAILASLTFIMINQALVALLGPPGRYLSLILTVLQLASAGATYPVETAPWLFQALHPYLPMTSVVNAFRSSIAGGTLDLIPVILTLGAYFLVGLAMVTAAVILKRKRHDAQLSTIKHAGEAKTA